MTVFFESPGVTLHHGDCLDVLRELPDASVDAVVTDPPYGLEFMGKEWDSFKTGRSAAYSKGGEFTASGNTSGRSQDKGDYSWFGSQASRPNYTNRPAKRCGLCGKQAWSGSPCRCPEPQWVMDNSPLHSFQQWCELWAAECLRVLKPGGHMLAFGGTRTFHRLACAVEDAGFEIRDSIAWLYGSGFPKSLDVSKAIDKAAGAEREVVGAGKFASRRPASRRVSDGGEAGHSLHFGDGHSLTAPATDAAREWQGWGTALKPAFEPVVVARKPLQGTVAANVQAFGTGALNIDGCRIEGAKPDTTRGASVKASSMAGPLGGQGRILDDGRGRWPANVVLDESQAAALDEQSGEQRDGVAVNRNKDPQAEKPHEVYGGGWLNGSLPDRSYGGSGGASRFFYTAKADAGERVRVGGVAHPTVKPLSLMRWLVRLVTPPGGTVLEPFAGSGTTVEACILEGLQCIAVEREADYLPLIVQRVNRQRDPIAYTRTAGEDLGLFELGEAVS